MSRKNLKDLDEGKAIHAVWRERKINRIVLPLGALFVFFLMWAAMINFAMFIKAVLIASIIVYIYFFIAMCFNIHDKIKK